MGSERNPAEAAGRHAPEIVGHHDALDPVAEAERCGATGGSPTTRRRRSVRARRGVLAVIAVGGMLGASARYGVAQLLHAPPGSFPWATFWTNVSGSLALGISVVVMFERFPPSRYLRVPYSSTM